MFATLDKSPPCTESENPKQLFSSTSTPSASTFPRKSLHRSRSSDTLAHESQYEEIKCFEHGTELKKKESKDLKQRVERMSDSSRNDRKEKKEFLKRENSNLSDSYRNKLQAATWGGKIGRKSEEEVEMRKKVEKMQTTEKISSDQSKNLFLFDAFADLAEKEKAVMNSTRNSKVDENNNAINCSVMSSTPSSKKTTCHNKPPNSPSTTTNTSMPLKRVISSNSSGFVSEENTSDGSVPSYTSTGSCDGVFYPKVENNLDKRKSSDEIQTRFSKGFNKLEILEKQLQRNLKEQEYLEKQHTLLRQASFPQFGELNKTSLDEDVHLNVRQPREVLNRPTRPDKPPPLPPKSYNKTNNTVTPKTEYYNKKNKLSLCNQSSSYQVGGSANEHGSRTQLNIVKESLVRSATSPEVFNISRTDILNHDDFSPQITYPQDRFFSPHKNAPINNFTNHVIVVNVNQESLYDNNNGSRNSNNNNNSHNSSFHFEDSRTSSISSPSHKPLQSPTSQILHSTFAPPSPILPPSLSHPHFSSSGSRRPSLPPLHEKSFKSSRTSEFDDEEYKKPKNTSRVHNGEDVQQSNAFNGLTKQDDYEENTALSSSERVPNVSSHLKAPPLPPKMLRTTKSEASLRAKMQINEEKNILRKENIDKSDKVEEEEINIETNVSRPNEKKTSEKGGDEGVEGMGVEDVCEWLKAISFTSFLKEFRSRRVDGVELFQLKRHHLVAMGMHSLETRRDFERALMKLKKNL